MPVDLVLRTEDGLGEVELGDDLEVGPAHRAGPSGAAPAEGALAAEERVEDVADAAEAGEGITTARLPGAADAGVAEPVVASPLLRVAQDLPRLGDLLEVVLGVGVVGVGVGVQLPRLGPVGPLDVVLGGVARDAEELVEVGHEGSPVSLR